MTRWSFTTIAVLALTTALAGAPAARAGLLPVSFTVTPEAGNTRFTYGVVLTTDAYIQAGDFFTVYEFAGFIPGSNVQPDGWSFQAGVGKTPPNTTPVSDPNLPNLTWVYEGKDKLVGQLGLGNFSAATTLPNFDFGSFTAQTHRQVDDHIDHNITDTQVPIPDSSGGGGGGNTPEPATLALMGIGLPLVGVLRFLRRRRN